MAVEGVGVEYVSVATFQFFITLDLLTATEQYSE